ncbi:low molecular weight protein-tyrosine-phosphatase [Allomuricauda sp.]|jgi:protein-tyrosine phosphatase|uniref:low molecular weight protein-tyrosine-phosphatase n=1 Tax=Flagellimonas sp. TaxID=2058762 RepID=UPI001B2717A2|nr:low molecular weight protein-tyrosine-phosphatase [Allomuricauda sp.]MBO6829971.1 low molecular weight phosphotyrosine protein phosphatase [Allomuricauda sp.]
MKTKVLMVCLGNICRSPLAEGILRSKVDSDKVLVDSAGTAGYHIGNPPDKRSIAVAQKYGLDISHQRCRKFSRLDFLEFDLIYVMDRSNFSDVAQLASNAQEAQKVKLLLSEVDLDLQEVPDPYYGGADGFENVYQMVDQACEAIAKKLN